MLNISSIDDFIEYNKIVNNGDCKIVNLHSLNSSISSYHYYNNIYDQISSIFKSLLLNHAFLDGNKRVAVMFLLVTCVENNIQLIVSDDELYDIVMDIIKNKPSCDLISAKLFK